MNYNKNFRYSNPNNWFWKTGNQPLRNNNRRRIERDSNLPEPAYNLEDNNQIRGLKDNKQDMQEANEGNGNIEQGRRMENRKLKLNPNVPDFIGSRGRNAGNKNITLQQPLNCYNFEGKGHMRSDCWYSQGNASGDY